MTAITGRRREMRDVQRGFRGGLNLSAETNQLSPEDMRRADNTHLNEFGGAVKRRGLQRVSVAALMANAKVMGGFGWVNGSTVTQLAVSNGALYTGSYAIPMTWAAQSGALSSTAKPSFAAFRHTTEANVYIADGGLLNAFDGTNFDTDISSTPAVSFVWVYNRRLYGVNGTDEKLYSSALDDGHTLGISGSGGAEFNIRTFGSQALIAGMAIGASNILFHRNGISIFTGWTQDDFNIESGTRGLSSDCGTIAPYSVIAVENVGYFLSDHGFYRVTEAGIEQISHKIDPVIDQLDRTLFSRVCATQNRARHEVMWYLPDIGVYAYNYRIGAWSGPFKGGIFTQQAPYSMWETQDEFARPIALTGWQDGFVRRFEPTGVVKDDVLSDGSGGVNYTQSVACRRMFSGSETREKAYRRLFVHYQARESADCHAIWSTKTSGGSAELETFATPAWDDADTEWDTTGPWDGVGTDIAKVHAHGRGEYIDITVECRDAAEAVFSRVESQGFDYGERV